jgi:hypothetical protein
VTLPRASGATYRPTVFWLLCFDFDFAMGLNASERAG